jgi:hypothetical protein
MMRSMHKLMTKDLILTRKRRRKEKMVKKRKMVKLQVHLKKKGKKMKSN